MQHQPASSGDPADGHIHQTQEGAGDEAAYVYVDLSGIKNDLIPAVGARISIRGLDTATPEVELGDGKVLRGEYEDSIGSLMFFAREQSQPSSISRPMDAPEGTGGEVTGTGDEAGPSEAGGANTQRASAVQEDSAREPCQLLCHTEQVLKVVMPPSDPS